MEDDNLSNSNGDITIIQDRRFINSGAPCEGSWGLWKDRDIVRCSYNDEWKETKVGFYFYICLRSWVLPLSI